MESLFESDETDNIQHSDHIAIVSRDFSYKEHAGLLVVLFAFSARRGVAQQTEGVVRHGPSTGGSGLVL